MDFYTEPAFFVVVGVLMIPAIALGCLERSIKQYGFAVSIVLLALLFSQSLETAAACVFFVALSFVLHRWVLHLFKTENARAVAWYRVALACNIAPLVIYKVSAIFDGNVLGFLGISYMMFKAVQVLIETRDGLIKDMSVFDYLYFLLFFPTFTSGPVMRSRDFCKDVGAPMSRSDYLDGFSYGLLRILAGMVYKFVLAAVCFWFSWFGPDLIGSATPAAFAGSELVSAIAYGLYLFFDFAGYSLMAIGVGAAFGIRVPRNFNMPFLSIDIKDFWNRWHMSLSYWLRDFVFMRLTRALLRRKVFASRVTTACAAYIVNMTLMGAWHGLTVDYLVYGVYHGLLLACCELIQRKSKFYKAHKDNRAFKVASWALNMIAVFFGFSLFSGQITVLVMGMW